MSLRINIDQLERPSQCYSYEKLLFFTNDGQPILKQNASRPQIQSPPQPHSPQLHPQPDQRWKQPGPIYSTPPIQPLPPIQNPPESWKQRGQSSRGARRPAPPMPKKIITNPIEILSREALIILNKITPQTFIKLTGRLSEIPIHNSAMLEELVRLIFNKAVLEPSFANLYAEMCTILDSSNNYTNFCHVVWNRDTNQYLWLKDIQYGNVLAGPYSTLQECINACLSHNPPPTQLINHPVTVAELVIVNGKLISVSFFPPPFITSLYYYYYCSYYDSNYCIHFFSS